MYDIYTSFRVDPDENFKKRIEMQESKQKIACCLPCEKNGGKNFPSVVEYFPSAPKPPKSYFALTTHIFINIIIT